MNTFNYNSSQINYYTTVDLGSIESTPLSTIDNGETSYDLVVTSDYIVDGDYIINDYNQESYGEINFTETTYPFGSVKITSTTNSSATVVFVSKPKPIILYEKAIVVTKQAWTGSGTLFEIANGLERTVAPYIGSSGPLIISGSAVDSGTFTYTEDSIKAYGVDADYGVVTDAIGSSIDNGQVTDIVDGGETDYGDIIPGDGRPYGLFNVSGYNSTDLRIKAWKGTGNTSISGEAFVQFSEPVPQIYVVKSSHLFNIYNIRDTESFTRTTYVGSGSLFNIGDRVEKATYSYNAESYTAQSVQLENYGSLDTSAATFVDYGDVTSPASGGEISYGTFETDFTRFGSLRFTGSASVIQTDHYTGNLNTEILPSDLTLLPDNFFELNRSIDQVTVSDSGTGLGSTGGFIIGRHLRFNGAFTPRVASFNIDSTEYDKISITVIRGNDSNGGEDPDLATESLLLQYFNSNTNPNFVTISTVVAYNDTSFDSLKTVTFDIPLSARLPGTTFRLYQQSHSGSGWDNYGVTSIVLTSSTIPDGVYTSIPSTIKLSGSVNVQFIEPPNQFYVIDNRTLFVVSGGYTDLSFTKGNYAGSGSLFRIGEKIEKAVFSYNSSSILITEDPVDNGSVTSSPQQVIDYGQVTESTSGELQFGDIIGGDGIPYGLFSITGSSIERSSSRIEANPDNFGFTLSGSYTNLKFSSQAGENTLLFTASGGDRDSVTKPFIGSGSLFNIGDRVERATYSYNPSSSTVIEDPYDYGDLTSFTSSVDYGYVSESYYENTNYGDIITTPGEENPFGLFSIIGSADYEFFPTFAWKSTGGFKFTHQPRPTDTRFMPWWRGYGEFNVYNNVIPDAVSKVYTGSGNLFNIGDKLESVTYDYNQSSVVEFTTGTDYGDITNSSTNTIDYGLVTEISDSGEFDFGSIVITDITYPLTGLFKFDGFAKSQFIRGPYRVIRGGFRFTHQPRPTDTRFQPWWRGYGEVIFNSTISAETPRSKTFIGSGSLFNIGDRVERATYSYNTSSIEIYETAVDYNDIATAATSTIDYGSIVATSSGGEVDLGSIITATTTEPFGLFNISGSSISKWIQVFTKIGSGTLFSFNSSAESKTSNPPENTALYQFSGTKKESFSKGLYTGSGSLFNIGDRVEKATYSYNTSSIDSESPFGLFEISGSGAYRKISREIGSGEIFSASGAAEAFSAQTPENTFLYRFSGSAVEKHIENYVGSGNLKIKEETPLAPNAAVRFRPWWRAVGGINISGFGEVEDVLINYVSRGGGFRLYTSAEGLEWRSYRPSPRYVNSIYGNIGGTFTYNGNSTTKKINVYGYYGDLKDPGASGTLFSIGGSSESRTISLTSTGLFEFNGVSRFKSIKSFNGSGTLHISGTPGLKLIFNLFGNVNPTDNLKVSGTPDLKIRRIYNGSGTLFNFESATETVGFSPDLDTGLFEISGAGKTNFSLLNTGSGSLFAIGSGAESTVVNPDQTTVLYRFSGSGTEKQSVTEIGSGSVSVDVSHEVFITRGYTGDGSLFGIGGDVDSVTQSESESVALFSIGGSAGDSFTRISSATKSEITINNSGDDSTSKIFVGSGSLFSIGSLEERVTFSRKSTVLFEFSGFATNIQLSKNFVGSGSLFAIGSGAESTVVNPEEDTILYRFTGRSVEKQTDRYVSDGVFEFISGTSDESSSKSFIGKGSLFSVISATESRAIAEDNTVLYSITGRANIKSVNKHIGSGTEFTSGAVDDSTTKTFTGSGSLFAVGNSAESRTISLESTQLFKTSGSATERFTRSTYNGSGQASITGEVSNIKRAFGNQVFAYQSISGNLIEKQTDSYVGTGSLFGFKNAAFARSIDIETSVSTNLLKINGTGASSVTRITETETIEISIYGESISKVQLFSPIRIFGTII